MKTELTEKEKIAREISKVDSGALYFAMGNEKSLEEQIDNHKREKWNQSVDAMQEKFANHEKRLQEAADEYAKKLDGVQIMPISNYVIVHPFVENPFQKVKVSSSGLIVDTGGLIPEYKRDDSGEYVEAEQAVKVGVVIEVGPECKWIRNGDTVMWYVSNEVVVPFYNFGFRLVNETRVICVINDDLNERFNRSK